MGSSNNKALKYQKQQDAERKATIEAAKARVNEVYSSANRFEDYQNVEDATRALLVSDLDRQKGDADRQTKFALARQGLSHGSTDIDQNRRLAEDYLRGVVEAERRSRSAGADLMSRDQETKAGLFSQILGGMDASTAGMQAASALRANVANSASGDYQTGFNNLFGNMADFWKTSKTAAADRRAAYDFNTLYGQRSNSGSPGIAGGVYGGQA